MKKATPVLAVLMMLVLLGGCANTPREQYSNVNDTFISAVSTLNAGKRAGVFSDEEWNETIVPIIRSANEVLREYNAATEAGAETESVAQRLSRLLQRLQPYIVEAVAETEGG
jgi:surfactin synthase thioesterase subunit